MTPTFNTYTGEDIGHAALGFNRAQNIAQMAKGNPRRMRAFEAARLVADVATGSVDPYWLRVAMAPPDENHLAMIRESYPALYPQGGSVGLRETMSRTDYQALFADVLDILFYGQFDAFEIFNESLVKIQDLNDTRFVKRYMLDGLVEPAQFMDLAAPAPQQSYSGPVPQDGDTYPTTNTEAVEYQPRLMQSKASINWSASLNDNLGIFREVPRDLMTTIKRGIAIFIHSLYAGNGDLNSVLFQAGYHNRILKANDATTDNPPLSAQGIMDAFTIIGRQRDATGQPILLGGRMRITYGSSNIATAQNLSGAKSIQVSVNGGNANAQGFPSQWLETNTWFVQNTDWIHDPYWDTGPAAGGFSSLPNGWTMSLDPGSVRRPGIELGYLRGFRGPQLFQKVPNTMRPGGGVEPMMGDFTSMNQEMKAMSILGGTQIDGRSWVGSTGTGTP